MQTMMGKTVLALFIVGILIAACAPSDISFVATPALSTETTKPFPTPSVPSTQESLYPSLERLCPEDPLVPLNELGLPSDVGLLVRPETLEYKWDEDDQGLFVIWPDNPTPTRLAFLHQEGYFTSSGASPSPDGNWLLFRRKAIADGIQTSWISSLDGSRQWPLDTSGELVAGYLWLDAETLLLFETPYDGSDGPIFPDPVPPLFRINPFTLEREPISNPPTVDLSEVIYYFTYSGNIYALYQEYVNSLNQFTWRLFDNSLQIDERVFEWLPVQDPANQDALPRVTGAGIVMIVDREYGFDFSLPMSPKQVSASNNYENLMQVVNLPPDILPVGLSIDGFNLFNIVLVHYSEEEISTVDDIPPPVYYRLDLELNRVVDFCFSVDGFRQISPDGKFLAITEYHSLGPQPISKSIYVVNLETGFITRIDGFAFLGWVAEINSF